MPKTKAESLIQDCLLQKSIMPMRKALMEVYRQMDEKKDKKDLDEICRVLEIHRQRLAALEAKVAYLPKMESDINQAWHRAVKFEADVRERLAGAGRALDPSS